MTAWDDEYRGGGVPSSVRDRPSSSVVWALDNWARTGGNGPATALDVGCGTARNAVYLASRGIGVIAFDASDVAIERGRQRVRRTGAAVELLVHDLRDGLPADDGSVDIVVDAFVYKHQVRPAARTRYREELARVLRPGGRVLISLAEPDDGYYGSCPMSADAAAGPNAVVDPAIGVDSALFTLAGLTAEMSDRFRLEMAWRKQQPGQMHGRGYVRRTVATLWSPVDPTP